MINGTFRAQTPVNVVGFVRTIQGSVAFVALAQAGAALSFTAAVVVGNHVLTPVYRIQASADPGNR